MRPRTLQVQAFRGWRASASIDLSAPITLLVGENRSGKSSTTNAIEWCLYGSLVEKKSPGLEERADWEVRPRDAGEVDTVVRLVLDDDDGRLEISRLRPADAKGRNPDRVSVRREGGSTLEGEEAERWIRSSALPPWEDYRRAHCFHQEAARTRVVDTGDRSTVLAELLGLDEDLRVRDAIAQQTRTSLVKEVDEILASLERTLLDRLANPRHELLGAEQALEGRGVPRATLGPALLQEVRTRMVERARELARRLEVDVVLPADDEPEAVFAWARAWPRQISDATTATTRVDELLAQHRRIEAARGGALPAQEAWRSARADHEEAIAKGGSEATRTARLREAEADLKSADLALKRTHQLAALLRDARPLIAGADEEANCPVCRTAVPALGTRVDEALRALESEEARRLADAREAAGKAAESARREVELLGRLARDERSAHKDHESKRTVLAGHLGVELDADTDLVAAAKARLDAIKAEGTALRKVETAQREAHQQHQDDLDLLRDLERWDRLRLAAERVVELETLAARPALDAAIDEAASYASDIEALANMARAAQEERSASRESDVNRGLGGYYALITGDAGDEVRVTVHRTAKRLTYKLVDAAGRPAVPVLNQAALNALSLAMLFAQAETRARAGGPDFVILDDPVQSLDHERQEGLARAVERLAATCGVVLASMPAHLVEHVREAVGAPRRIHHLAPWDPARGSCIDRTEDL